MCDGKGNVTAVGDDTDIPPDDSNPCTDDACTAGAPTHPAKANGAFCDDGSACTQGDSCQAGVCAGGTTLRCIALDACHVVGACDAATGVCSNPSVPDGLTCDDGESCTQLDTCQAGVCTGGKPVVCGGGLSCVAGVCAAACSGVPGFPGPPMSDVSLGPVSVAGADLNGDGQPDLVAGNDDGNSVSVLINQGNGTFAAHVDHAAGASPYSVKAVDLNNDSQPDLVVTNAISAGTVSVLLNQGNGTFAPQLDISIGGTLDAITAADLNGDGQIDLAAVNGFPNGAWGNIAAVNIHLNTCSP